MRPLNGIKRRHRRSVPIGSWVENGYPITLQRRSLSARLLIRTTIAYLREHAMQDAAR